MGVFRVGMISQCHGPTVEGVPKGLQGVALLELAGHLFHPCRLGTQCLMNHIHGVNRALKPCDVRRHPPPLQHWAAVARPMPLTRGRGGGSLPEPSPPRVNSPNRLFGVP
jgi:hypothetical protein